MISRLSPRQVLDVQAETRDRFTKPNFSLRLWLNGLASAFENVARAEWMFYPLHPYLSPDEAGRLARFIGRDLFSARAFQVSEKMVGVLEGVYAKTLEGVETVEPELLPSEAGFLWYDKPLEIIERTGGKISIRAVSWGPETIYYEEKDWLGRPLPDPRAVPGVRIVFWSRIGDPSDYPEEMTAIRDDWDIGDLIVNHTVVTPFGKPWPVTAEGLIGTSVLHWIFITWMLLETEIAGRSRMSIEGWSKGAKRISQSLKHRDVTVITLRRTHTLDGEEHGHRDVDWSCCWVVQAFWRHIEDYGSQFTPGHKYRSDGNRKESRCLTCGARGTRVKSHIRGPDDKPLKATSETLYLLRR
jgi:hypothetical protein